MSPECQFILPTGHKCRCAATRNQPFCRHHGPKPPGLPPLSRRQRYSRLARWALLGREIPQLELTQIPFEAYDILLSLLEDGSAGISDRGAGRLLRGLLRRFGSVPFSPPVYKPDAATPQPAPASGARSATPPALDSKQLDPRLLDALLSVFDPPSSASQPVTAKTRPSL